jgi:hypothetical protein
MKIWPWSRIAELEKDIQYLEATFDKLYAENLFFELRLNKIQSQRSAAVSKGNRTRAANDAAKRAAMTQKLADEVAARK